MARREVRPRPAGGIVVLLGANKSTTLKAISGLLRTERGDITKGSIELRRVPIHQRNPSEIVRRGIVQVMEGRHVFELLTVEENLLPQTRPRSGVYLLPAADPAPGDQGRLLSGGSSRCWPSAGH